MDTFDRDTLISELERDEGKRSQAYDDDSGHIIMPNTLVKGWVTTGTGRNLVGKGISEPERLILLNNDINDGGAELDQFLQWWRKLSDARQRAMINLSFMGIGTPGGKHGLLSLTGFLSFMQKGALTGDPRMFASARADLLGTAYARQVGARATRLGDQIEAG